jgi:cytochrome c biogenesis protein CcmG/thiol:disulfide interchange protein DsbE
MNETISTPEVAPAEEPKQGFRWGRLLIWGGVLAVLAVLGWGLLKVNEGRPDAADVAPNFDMQFFDGYEWQDMPAASLSDMEGNVVVLNFWASWCIECRVEADLLENAWRQYKDDGVIFLGVAYVDSEPKSLAYLEDFGITYPNAPDLGSSVSSKYNITGVPETFFIGKDGKVSRFVLGPVNSQVLHGEIAQLLAE